MNHFLIAKQHLVDTREIVQRTWDDYDATCKQVMEILGKERLVADLQPDDFESLRRQLAKSRGIVTLGNEVSRARILFKYAYDAGLIEQPTSVWAVVQAAKPQGPAESSPREGATTVSGRRDPGLAGQGWRSSARHDPAGHQLWLRAG